MEPITLNVSDVSSLDRQPLEHIVAQQLRDGHKVIIQVVEPKDHAPMPRLPEWCSVYKGLTLEEIEKIALMRARIGRPVE